MKYELDLIPLCEVTMQVGEPQPVGETPTGNLVIGEITSARWEGDRLRASLRGNAAGDWMTLTPDGNGVPDVRLTLETDDGALVFVSYIGRYCGATGIAYTTPTFRTGDNRYAWLNAVQAVGRGTFEAETGRVHYPMMYEMR